MKQLLPTDTPIERAIVVSVVKKGGDRIQAMDYLDELAFLRKQPVPKSSQKCIKNVSDPTEQP